MKTDDKTRLINKYVLIHSAMEDLKRALVDIVPDDMIKYVPPVSYDPDQSNVDYDDNAIPMESPEVYPRMGTVRSSTPDMSGEKGFPIVCSQCGKHSRVPFKPAYASKVFCPECFKANNGRRG